MSQVMSVPGWVADTGGPNGDPAGDIVTVRDVVKSFGAVQVL